MLSRIKKEQIISDLTAVLQEDQTVFVVEPKNVNVATFSSLRVDVRNVGGSVQMVKNTLAQRVVQNTAFEKLAPDFRGVTVLLIGTDSLGMAKAIKKFMKENADMLEYKTGMIDGALIAKPMMEQLASTPPIEQLRAQLLGVLSSTARELLRVLKAKPTAVVNVLSGRIKKGE